VENPSLEQKFHKSVMTTLLCEKLAATLLGLISLKILNLANCAITCYYQISVSFLCKSLLYGMMGASYAMLLCQSLLLFHSYFMTFIIKNLDN